MSGWRKWTGRDGILVGIWRLIVCEQSKRVHVDSSGPTGGKFLIPDTNCLHDRQRRNNKQKDILLVVLTAVLLNIVSACMTKCWAQFEVHYFQLSHANTLHTHYASTHTYTRLTALCPGLPGWAVTRNVKPIWILLKQEPASGSGISWAMCKSAPRSRQITMPTPHHSVFYRLDALPAAQPIASKHWRHWSWK